MKTKILFILAWSLLFTAGLMSFMYFSYTPGKHKVIGEWPTKSKIHLSSTRPTLVMFLHPKCSCSQATVSELSDLMEQVRDKVNLKIVIIKYKTLDLDSDVVHQAKRTPASEIVYDSNGDEAKLLGAETSGVVYLVDEKKNIVFQGGLTPSRGHRGKTYSQEFILDWLKNRADSDFIGNIFGCGL